MWIGDGLILEDTTSIQFKTEEETYSSGTIVDDFEVRFGWLDPKNTPTTSGINEENTSFELSTTKKISGSYSGKLKYEFTEDSGGICRLQNEERIEIITNPESEFGLWIFGDYSFNLLELWFDDASQYGKVVLHDTLNWAGWKLIRFPVSTIQGTGKLYFQSVVVYQIASASKNGTLYLDDVQYDIQLTDLPEVYEDLNLAKTFLLFQNYPNPFNPLTNIKYMLPKKSYIKLEIINIIGQKVVTLVNEKQNPGIHKIEWNAKDFTTGIYFYKIQYDNKLYVRKLILMK